MTNKSIIDSISNLTNSRKNLFEEVASTIWHYAELNNQEYKSSKYLCSKLDELGFKVTKGIGYYPTSFVAEFSTSSDGPIVGLLCEYDALPGLSSIKKDDNGHGCGHNLFAAGAITTAAIIKEYITENNINAKIKIFGTPAEENNGCKPYFAKQGIFDGVDFFMGFHPLEFNGILYKRHNAIISKKYKFFGKTSHAGAEPELGISALDAVEIMNVSVNYLREHVTQDVRIHYIITHGGKAVNIVPDFAESEYAVRAQEYENLHNVSKKIDNAAKGAALATGCNYEIEYIQSFANTVLNRPYAELAYEYLSEIGPPDFTDEDQNSVSEFGSKNGLLTNIEELPAQQGSYGASTDEGDVSWQAPWIRICMSVYADGTPGHSIEVTKQSNMPSAFKGMLQNIKVCACTITDILLNPNKLKEIKDYYNEAVKGKEYDRSKNKFPNLKIFPDTPGVKVCLPNTVTIEPDKHVYLEELEQFSLKFYINNELIGEKNIDKIKKEKTYSIKTKKTMDKEDVIVIKYKVAEEKDEVLLGYFQHNYVLED